MKRKSLIISIFVLAVILAIAGINVASAQCDTMDGPVVKAAREDWRAGM